MFFFSMYKCIYYMYPKLLNSFSTYYNVHLSISEFLMNPICNIKQVVLKSDYVNLDIFFYFIEIRYRESWYSASIENISYSWIF